MADDIIFTGGIVGEHAQWDTLVATAIAQDVDVGETHTYSIVGGNEDGRFEIDATSGEVRLVQPLDHEDVSAYSLIVRATESGGLFIDRPLAITVTDVAEAGGMPFPLASEVLVNTFTTGNQFAPAAAALSGGGYVIVWQDAAQDGSAAGVYGRLFDAAGTALTGEFPVNTETDGFQSQPSVAALSDGGFVVTWNSAGQDGSGLGVYGQQYNMFASPVGSEFQVNTETNLDQQASAVAGLSDGGFVVAWQSNGQDGDAQGVFAQRYDDFGFPAGIEFQVTTETAGFQSQPSVAALSDGGFVVTWTSSGQDTSGLGIYGQRYDMFGFRVGLEFQVNTEFFGDQQTSSVAALPRGGFVVTWVSTGQDGSGFGVYGQRYDASGIPDGVEFQVNTETAGNQSAPSVTALPDNGFIVTWVSPDDDGNGTGGTGVYGQRYDASGAQDGGEFQLNAFATGDQLAPAVTALSDGVFVVAWQSVGQDGDGNGVISRRFYADTVNTPPFNVELSATTVAENADGAVIGILSTIDQDTGDGHSYAITGGTGAARFEIGTDGGNPVLKLRAGESLDFENPSDTGLTVAVQTTDSRGSSFTRTFTIGVQDVTAGDTLVYGPGDDIIAFPGTENVDGVDGGGGDDTLIVTADAVTLAPTGDGLGLYFELDGIGGAPADSIIDRTLTAHNVEAVEIHARLATIGGDLSQTGLAPPTVVYVGDGQPNILDAGGITSATSVQASGMDGDDDLTGGAGDDILDGGAGDDVLDGGAGGDIMTGGPGDDIYVVDDMADVIVEGDAEGNDTMQTTVSRNLFDNVENLVLLGSGAIHGAGNALDNVITGNSGNNWIDGKAGNDTMIGGAGDDHYVVRDAGDMVIELPGEGIDRIGSYISWILPDHVEKLFLLGTAHIDATGNELDNVFLGNTGDNVIDGGLGADVMTGGLGDDIYVMDNVRDRVVEAAGEGSDTVRTSIALALPDNVENLEMLGSGDLAGSGNSLANVITGNSGNNWIDGKGGGDTMIGGLGDDRYVVREATDIVIELEGEGTDRIASYISIALPDHVEQLVLVGSDGIDGTGNALDNLVIGNSGDNILNGAAGADRMLGGLGDDIYVVDSTADRVVEAFSEGIDTVRATVTLILPENVENLQMLGSANINGSGNSLDNVITGNSGNNILDGKGGFDTLVGGLGNDTYVIRSGAETVIENAAEGTDRVHSFTTVSLYADVENLLLLGNDDIGGYGNELDNEITGNSGNNFIDGGLGDDIVNGGAGNDTINGGFGNDVLTGGPGADSVVFDTFLDPINNVDVITDFSVVDDVFSLSFLIFPGVGLPGIPMFPDALVVGPAAGDPSDRIIYDITTGAISYDPDGSGTVPAIQFAAVSPGLALTNLDFMIM